MWRFVFFFITCNYRCWDRREVRVLRGEREPDNVPDRTAWRVNGRRCCECQRSQRGGQVAASRRSFRRRCFSWPLPYRYIIFTTLHFGKIDQISNFLHLFLFYSSTMDFDFEMIGLRLLKTNKVDLSLTSEFCELLAIIFD